MNDKIYVFDLNAIIEFVLKQDDSRTSNSEITETYITDEEGDDLILAGKELREMKNNGDTSSYTLRYDLIKTFLGILVEGGETNGLDSFMQKMAFNSLLTQGMIKEIDPNN